MAVMPSKHRRKPAVAHVSSEAFDPVHHVLEKPEINGMEHVCLVQIRGRNPVEAVKNILADTKSVTHDVVVIGLRA